MKYVQKIVHSIRKDDCMFKPTLKKIIPVIILTVIVFLCTNFINTDLRVGYIDIPDHYTIQFHPINFINLLMNVENVCFSNCVSTQLPIAYRNFTVLPLIPIFIVSYIVIMFLFSSITMERKIKISAAVLSLLAVIFFFAPIIKIPYGCLAIGPCPDKAEWVTPYKFFRDF